MTKINHDLDRVLAWSGKSQLNGEEIILAVNGISKHSNNPKTGSVVQTYILLKDENPMQSVMNGNDEAVCGDCPLRRNSCYVNVGKSVAQVWKATILGKYTPGFLEIHQKIVGFYGKMLRIGSYGDPTAVPFVVWENLIKHFKKWVGYTHQWRSCDRNFQKYIMASVEKPEDAIKAQLQGWRTYRIINEGDKLLPNEILCPNSQNNLITCEICGLCNGMTSPEKPNIAVVVHGIKYKVKNFSRL
jgi:hypothetical protein